MLGRDAAAYARRYRELLRAPCRQAKAPKTMLDPAPRMVLDPQLGFAAAGRDAREAAIIEELYDHTHRRHPARRGARRLARASARTISSTSSTGTWSRRSCARPARRRCSAARWRWSPARPRASARRASTLSCGAAPRWSASTAIPRSKAMWQRPGFSRPGRGPDRRRSRWTKPSTRPHKTLRRRRHAGAERRHLPLLRAACRTSPPRRWQRRR